MRVTEALHCANPNHKLDKELEHQLSHYDYKRHTVEIKRARLQNRRLRRQAAKINALESPRTDDLEERDTIVGGK